MQTPPPPGPLTLAPRIEAVRGSCQIEFETSSDRKRSLSLYRLFYFSQILPTIATLQQMVDVTSSMSHPHTTNLQASAERLSYCNTENPRLNVIKFMV